MSPRVEGEWRCPACRHGRKLTAWATANVTGKLNPDGEVDWTDGEQFELHEDSIMCTIHHTERAGLERWFRGRWCQLAPCTWTAENFREMPWKGPFACEGGVVKGSGRYGLIGDYGPCPNCRGNGELWLPRREAVAVLAGLDRENAAA